MGILRGFRFTGGDFGADGGTGRQKMWVCLSFSSSTWQRGDGETADFADGRGFQNPNLRLSAVSTVLLATPKLHLAVRLSMKLSFAAGRFSKEVKLRRQGRSQVQLGTEEGLVARETR